MPWRKAIALLLGLALAGCATPTAAPTPDPSVIAAAVASALAAERARSPSPAPPAPSPEAPATATATATAEPATEAPSSPSVAPSAAVAVAPSAPAPASPRPTSAPTAVPRTSTPGPATAAPTPADPCPSTGDPATTGVDGTVYYGTIGAPGATVYVAPSDGSAVRTLTTDERGYFRALGLAPGITVTVSLAAQQELYTSGATVVRTFPFRTCGGKVVPIPVSGYNFSMFRYITGINYAYGATVPRGATLTWDPIPGATSYCVETGMGLTVLPTTTCPGYNAGFIVTTPKFTLPGDARDPDRRFGVIIRAFDGTRYIGFLRGGDAPCCDGYYAYTLGR